MHIQWDMAGINGHFRLHGQFQLFIKGALDPLCSCPEQAMVDDQQVTAHFHCLTDYGQCGIDCRGDFLYWACAMQLQPVEGPGIIRYFTDFELFIEIVYDVFKLCHASLLRSLCFKSSLLALCLRPE